MLSSIRKDTGWPTYCTVQYILYILKNSSNSDFFNFNFRKANDFLFKNSLVSKSILKFVFSFLTL